MADSSQLATAGIVGGVLSFLTVIGHAIQWLAGWGDKRAARLAKEEGQLDESWSAYRKRIEERLQTVEAEASKRAQENMALRLAFEIVAGELRRADPNNGSLRRAEQLLAAAFPLEPIVPVDMPQTLIRIDEAEARSKA